MRFTSIAFKNYRCFLDGTIDFGDRDNKSLNLIVGQNGAGKTELLFAFYWVLYGFDFKDLLMKESTPYALNLDLYRELSLGEIDKEVKCSVTLKFESDNKPYQLIKTETYRKNKTRITKSEESELRHFDEHGAASPPIRDINKIEHVLFDILPPNVAYGIFFDGERMKKLSAIDQHSRIIEEVISEITSVQIVEKSTAILRNIQKGYTPKMRRLKQSASDKELIDYADEKVEVEGRYDNNSKQYEENKRQKREFGQQLEQINSLLREVDDNKELIQERHNYEVLLKEERIRNQELIENDFIQDLKNDGHLLLLEKLFNDVEGIIKEVKVPEGLTSGAVESILKQENCICGKRIDDKHRKKLEELQRILPPTNLNSQILSFATILKDKADNTKNLLNKKYQEILKSDKKIHKYESIISDLNKKIVTMGSDSIREYESERENAIRKIAVLDERQKILEIEINNDKHKLETLTKKLDNISVDNTRLKSFMDRIDFISKSIKAFEEIKVRNKKNAINIINKLLYDNYNSISEDSTRGLRAYIVNLDEDHKYSLIVYNEETFKSRIVKLKESGEYAKQEADGFSPELIEEKVKINISEPKSTGQGKVLALSFVQSILEYSSSNKSNDEFELIKNYPLIIDAPFTEIFGRNLFNLSKRISSFSKQVILMLSKDSYEQVENNITQFIGSKYLLKKNYRGKSFSTIRREF